MTHTTSEPAATNVAEAPKAAIPADLTAPTVAANDVAPALAVESVAAAPVQEEHDDLMALVQSRPAEEPAATVAEATPEAKQVQTVVTAESARAARIAANTAKQQRRINARLARVNGQQNTQTAALEAGTHRVADGDTLLPLSTLRQHAKHVQPPTQNAEDATTHLHQLPLYNDEKREDNDSKD